MTVANVSLAKKKKTGIKLLHAVINMCLTETDSKYIKRANIFASANGIVQATMLIMD